MDYKEDWNDTEDKETFFLLGIGVNLFDELLIDLEENISLIKFAGKN